MQQIRNRLLPGRHDPDTFARQTPHRASDGNRPGPHTTIISRERLHASSRNPRRLAALREGRRSIEAHLFDASGDFYGDLVEVGFVARLRDTRRFENIEALMAQLRADDEAARRALTTAAS